VDDRGPLPDIGERRQGPRRASDVPKPACPWCGASTSTVARARPKYATLASDDGYHRMRLCAECLRQFPTTERVNVDRFARLRAAVDRAAARVAGSLSSVLAPSSRMKPARR
jgi:hypothetical protein